MRAIAILVLFVGVVLLIQGYYDKRSTCPPPQVEVRYIPSSQYEEATSNTGTNILSKQFGSLFEDIDPWNNNVSKV